MISSDAAQTAGMLDGMMNGLDGTIEALMYKKTCELCGKSFECIRPHGKYCSISCKRIARYNRDPEKYRKKARESVAKSRSNNPEKYRQCQQQWKKNNKEKVQSYRRKEKEKIGKIYKTNEERKKDALLRKQRLESEQRSYREARQAWKYWMKEKAPMGWIARYYKSMGKPWLNHRLSETIRYRIRYRMDEAFRQKEIHRAGARREFIRTVDDGTHDYRSLLMERKTCPYCGKRLNQKNRAIDHMDPVAHGSSHSISNMVACCKNCNEAKRDKSFSDWVLMLKEQYKMRSLAVYKRKRRSLPEQLKFDLFFD